MEQTTKSLIEGCLHKADKKLSVAEKLFKSGDYEDAVSRAYYAVFHAAQALLLTEGEKAESHKGEGLRSSALRQASSEKISANTLQT